MPETRICTLLSILFYAIVLRGTLEEAGREGLPSGSALHGRIVEPSIGACGWNGGRGQSWQYFNSTKLGQSVRLVLDRGQNEGTFSPFHIHRHLGDPQADQ